MKEMELFIKNSILFNNRFNSLSDTARDVFIDIVENGDSLEEEFTLKSLYEVSEYEELVIKRGMKELVESGLAIKPNRIKYTLNKKYCSLTSYGDESFEFVIPKELSVTEEFNYGVVGLEDNIILTFVALALDTKCKSFSIKEKDLEKLSGKMGLSYNTLVACLNLYIELGFITQISNNLFVVSRSICLYNE